MKWYIVLTFVSVFLLLPVVEPALAQMGGDRQQMGGHGKASNMMEYGKTIRTQQDMHGMGFMYSAWNAYGDYVTLQLITRLGCAQLRCNG